MHMLQDFRYAAKLLAFSLPIRLAAALAAARASLQQ